MQWIAEAPSPPAEVEEDREPVGVRVTFLASSMRVKTFDESDTLRRQNWYLKNGGKWRVMTNKEQQEAEEDLEGGAPQEGPLQRSPSNDDESQTKKCRIIFFCGICLILIAAAATMGALCGVGVICNVDKSDDGEASVVVPGEAATNATTNSQPSTNPSGSPTGSPTTTSFSVTTLSPNNSTTGANDPLEMEQEPVETSMPTFISSPTTEPTLKPTVEPTALPEPVGLSVGAWFREPTMQPTFQSTIEETTIGETPATSQPTSTAQEGKEQAGKQQETSEPTMQPSTLPILELSIAQSTPGPTQSPTLEQSKPPSTETTNENNREPAANNDILILNILDSNESFATLSLGTTGSSITLPRYSISSVMYEGLAPQTKAFAWMSNNVDGTMLLQMEEWRKLQMFTLATIYFALDGDSWSEEANKGWLNGSISECEWTAHYRRCSDCTSSTKIQCSEDERMIALEFENFDNDLTGTFPIEITLLTSLEVLKVTDSGLSGQLQDILPWEFMGDLQRLSYLSFYNNGLEGQVPTEVGLLTGLQVLHLENNTLSGIVPQSVCDMSLPYLGVGCNEGGISCPADCNCASGCVGPEELATVSPTTKPPASQSLWGIEPVGPESGTLYTTIELGDTGTNLSIPDYTITALANPSAPQSRALTWMLTSYSTGDLLAMPQWRKQQIFTLATIFYSLGGNTWDVKYENNWLNASLPECLWARRLGYLPQINCLETGQVSALSFYDTVNLNGVFPPEIELLSSLEQVRTSKTRLNESLENILPWQQLRRLRNLTELRLGNSFLTGTLPTELSSLTALTHLGFFDNELSGTIHTELGLLSNLEALRLPYNTFSGLVPSELGQLTKLTLLDLAGNNLSGKIPSELGQLTNLGALYLEQNSLSAVIPFIPNPVCGLRLRDLWIDCYDGNTTCSADCNCKCFTQLVV